MNHAKIVVTAILAAMLSCTAIMAASTTSTSTSNAPSVLDNAYLDAGVGASETRGAPGQVFQTAGGALGLPLKTAANGLVFVGQVGGNVALVETDGGPNTGNYDAQAGLIVRNIRLETSQVAVGLLADYDRTFTHDSVGSFTPIAGTTLGSKDEAGIVGTRHLNSSNGERAVDEGYVFWTHEWSSKLESRLEGGYQFSFDNIAGKAALAYALTPSASVVLSGLASAAQNYAIEMGVTFGANPNGIAPVLQNIRGTGANPILSY